jgi:hypothetical protein
VMIWWSGCARNASASGDPRQVAGIERMVGRTSGLWRLRAWSRQGGQTAPPALFAQRPVLLACCSPWIGFPLWAPNQRGCRAARAEGGIRVLMTHTITANGGAPEFSPKQMLAESVRARLDGPGPVR